MNPLRNPFMLKYAEKAGQLIFESFQTEKEMKAFEKGLLEKGFKKEVTLSSENTPEETYCLYEFVK